MSALIAPLPVVRRQEPMMVTQLRKLIRQGAVHSILVRVAGSEAELLRLSSEYGLRGKPVPVPRPAVVAAPPPRSPAERRVELFGYIEQLATEGKTFPSLDKVSRAIDQNVPAIETGLRRLVRCGAIRIGTYVRDHKVVRRIDVVARGISTAAPAGVA